MTTEFVLAVLSFLAIFALGAAYVVTVAAHRRRVQSRLTEKQKSDSLIERDQKTAKSDGLNPLARFASRVNKSKPSEGLKARLASSGFHHPGAPAVFLGSKMVLLLVGTIGATLLTLPFEFALYNRVLLIVGAGSCLSLIPDLVVARRRSHRRFEVQTNLAHAVDLLEICVSSGMGLDMAWNSVADEIRPVSLTLADEMALTNLEMQLGVTRTDAMRHMVDRTGADELGSLVAVLVQCERFGTSIADSLKTFAGTLREIRSQKAHEAAEKMAVKLLFPLVLFIFPVMFIAVAGPAGIRIVDIIAGN